MRHQPSVKLQWLHVSDVHIRAPGDYDRNVVFDALINSLPNLKKQGLIADVAFFTGDIGFSGNPAEYHHATAAFDRLLSALELSKSHLFVVPGNHDVDRRLGVGLGRTLQSEDESQRYFSGSEPLLHASIRQKAFRDWYNGYFADVRTLSDMNSCGPYEELDFDGYRVGVLPINTAVFSSDDHDHGNLWIGRRALERAVADVSKRADLVLGLMHHPLDWLNEIERTQITSRLRQFCDCLLRGHLHQNEIEQIESRSDSALHAAAGALYQGSQWPNCAQFVEVSADSFSIRPIRYSDTPSPQWVVDTSIYPTSPSYFGYIARHHNSETANSEETSLDTSPIPVLEHAPPVIPPTRESSAQFEFERDLFVGPSGGIIYVEPRLSVTAPQQISILDHSINFTSVSAIVASQDSFVIYCQPEYGGTTLSKRLYLDILRAGAAVELHDANQLPQYRAKLKEMVGVGFTAASLSTLILDNFDCVRHERLVKELGSLARFSRMILISTMRGAQFDIRPPSVNAKEAKKLFLWNISRQDVRVIAEALLDTADDTHVSSIVEKVYGDLLSLSIPLTPSNSVMYIRVLSREHDFQPFNRVDIVERYMGAALSTSSDAFAGALTSKDKLEILTEFAHSLYSRSASCFSDIEWHEFSKRYVEETLTAFSATELLRNLEDSKILFRFADKLYFKYSFYFSFLVGRYIASRPEVCATFLASHSVYALYGVVETIAGLTADGTRLIEHLTVDLESKLEEFSQQFIPRDFDPLATAEWELSSDDEAVWEKVNRSVEEGPVASTELDLIRTSFSREAQTADQEIRYSEFKSLEYEVFVSSLMLTQALKASHGVRAAIKKRALTACLMTDLIGLQLGTILAREIAKRDWVQWGGAIFLGFKSNEADSKDELAATVTIVSNLPNAVALRCAEDLASKKLGEAFKAIIADFDVGSFLHILAFSCIATAKPSGWVAVIEQQIARIGRRAYYLAVMLNILMTDFKSGVNKAQDKDSLKRLIATIYAKRNYNKSAPGVRLVTDVMRELESNGTLAEGGGDIATP